MRDISTYKTTVFIVPTQHLMQKVLTILTDKYVPLDPLLLLYVKYHRDVMNQDGPVLSLDIFDEYEDDLMQLIIKFNRDRPVVDQLQSSEQAIVSMSWDHIRTIAYDVFKKLRHTEELIGTILSSSLPDAFYYYRCEPTWVRIYAGDMAVCLVPNKCLGSVYDAR